MDFSTIPGELIMYLGLVVLLTFHEFGHAWTALKCGDDTASLLGRVSLNPIDHIDPIGTVLIPLVSMFAGEYSRFLVGWAKPVPVNLSKLRNPIRDDILITMAGPAMNLILAVVLMGLARVGIMLHSMEMRSICGAMAELSLLLCFFNLIPIPPLDGSRVMRIITGMTYETYFHIARFGFIILIVVLQIPLVRDTLSHVTFRAWVLLAELFGVI